MKITIRENGPVRLELEEGDHLEVRDHQGRPFGLAGRQALSLCRCGHSQNKPFCDGSHNKEGFASSVEAHELPPAKA